MRNACKLEEMRHQRTIRALGVALFLDYIEQLKEYLEKDPMFDAITYTQAPGPSSPPSSRDSTSARDRSAKQGVETGAAQGGFEHAAAAVRREHHAEAGSTQF